MTTTKYTMNRKFNQQQGKKIKAWLKKNKMTASQFIKLCVIEKIAEVKDYDTIWK